jgi:citrate synthase
MTDATKSRGTIVSNITQSTPDRIVVKGFDLAKDLLGKVSFGDMAFIMLTDRAPNAGEAATFNAILIALVEHGLTPSVIAARMTYAGAPEAVQSAVAAGISGMGSVFGGSTEDVSLMLTEALAESPDLSIADVARRVSEQRLAEGAKVPGLGHHFHKPEDPRAIRLFEIAGENGIAGRYVELMKALAAETSRRAGKHVCVNATGAIGAISCELGLPHIAARGISIIARTVGLVGHLIEESRQPMARTIKALVDAENMKNRNQ